MEPDFQDHILLDINFSYYVVDDEDFHFKKNVNQDKIIKRMQQKFIPKVSTGRIPPIASEARRRKWVKSSVILPER